MGIRPHTVEGVLHGVTVTAREERDNGAHVECRAPARAVAGRGERPPFNVVIEARM